MKKNLMQFLILPVTALAQTITWTAVEQKTMSTVGAYLACDSNQFVYVCGYVAPSSSSTNETRSFISKYATNGTLEWSETTEYRDLKFTMDRNNNIYATGRNQDGYSLLKYSSEGELISEQTLFATHEGIYKAKIRNITCDKNNNIFIVGVFRDALSRLVI